jgi:methylenetetrahydrofolate dehydrogenase (NADP+)/methenyltetrahydrofolate cyclohydrolase
MKHKLLEGSEIAGFIKERQARVVRGMLHKPCLAIVRTNQDTVIDAYLRLKKAYAEDIGARVEVFDASEDDAPDVINSLNKRSDVHGIIIQLPLADPSKTCSSSYWTKN